MRFFVKTVCPDGADIWENCKNLWSKNFSAKEQG